MQTTIEMKPEHRAKLREIAAKRGEKGFSSVVAEAIDAYLEGYAKKDGIREKALQAGASLNKKDAAELGRRVAEIRAQWR